MIQFLSEYWNDLLVAIVGLSAYCVYRFEKRDKLQTGATLIIGQIDLIEKRVKSLKGEHQLGNIAMYHSKPIIKGNNMWEEYKHLFVKKLSRTEYEIIQEFFDNAEQLERTRQEILSTIVTAWYDKSSVEHQKVADMVLSEENCINVYINFKNNYRPLDLVFTPDIAINALTKNLNNFNMLAGTTAYQNLQKYSYTE